MLSLVDRLSKLVEAGFVSRTQVAAPPDFEFAIREACIADRAALGGFLTGLSQRARYLRFFSGAPPASQAMLRILAGGAAIQLQVACTDGHVLESPREVTPLPGPGARKIA